jgi:hypothetical protein
VDSGVAVAALPVIAAIAVAFTVRDRPLTAFAVLFLTAAFSRATLETPLGTMRPEMPATVVAAVLLARIHGIRALLTPPRAVRPLAIAFACYLVVIGLSSLVVAGDRRQSVLMVTWLAASMTAGVVSFHLVRPRPADAIRPLSLAGGAMGALGLLAAIVFLLAGPAAAPGIQDASTELPRVYGLAWETNLYASFLAMTAFFAFEVVRSRRDLPSVIVLCLLAVGFPLGITRGAWLGLAAGSVVVGLLWVHTRRSLRPIGAPALGAAAFLVVGLALTSVLLPGTTERATRDATVVLPSPGIELSTSPPPSGAGSLAPGGVGASPDTETPPAATAAPTALPSPAPMPDTVAFRLERVWIALAELPQSPLIGFGAESFGQRHPDRYAGSGPDHIAIMAVVVPYEAGLLGFAALVAGFGALVVSLWSRANRAALSGDVATLGASAAFLGAVTAMLVAYQVTNSLHMAINWMIIGAAGALIAGRQVDEPPAAP